jgi:hypothetical protein
VGWIVCARSWFSITVSPMTNVIRAELVREVLDDVLMTEKRAEQPALPAEELSPELWTVIWGHDREEESGKDYQLAALVGRVVAEAALIRASVFWTLTGTPPAGRTLPEAVADLGVTLHERWPTAWR